MTHISIRRRLLTALIGLATLPLLVAGGVLGWRAYQLSVAESHAHRQEVARRVAVQVEGFMQNFQFGLESGLRLSDFAVADAAARRQALARILAGRATFREAAFLDTGGRALIHLSNVRLRPEAEPVPAAFLAAGRAAAASGQVSYGAVYYDPANNEPLMLMAVPVSDLRSGRLAGVVVAEVRFKTVWNLIAGLDLAAGEDVYLLDSDGRIIAHRNPSVVLRETRVRLGPERRQRGLDGHEAFVAVQPFELGQRAFRVVAERDVGAVLRPALNGIAITGAVVLATLLGVFALGVPLARRISRPIIAVSEAARAIRDGDLERRVRVEGDDEIAELARTFNGMTARLRATVQDLAGYRHQLEELVEQRTGELRRQQAFAEAVLENVSDGIVACNERGELSLFNRATREMHGIDVEGLPPERWAEHYKLYLEDGVTPMQTGDIPLYRAFQGQVVKNQAMVIEHRDGAKLDLLASGQAMFDEHGDKIGAVVTMHDVTEQKHAKADLQRAKEVAEAANRAKSVFLANMSHELRTPLNAILGFAQIMARDAGIEAAHRRELETIDRAGHHLLSLINDVLEISRIEAGRTAIQNAPFDLRETLAAIEEMVRVRADAKGLALQVACHGRLPPYLMGDAAHLRQVLLNLLGNAVKYTDRGEVGLHLYPVDGQIRFEVTDTGPGIAPEEQERIFQAFYQTEVGIRKGEGTGLGLTISREFIRLMGGEITVASTPGQGSCFRFTLPLPATGAPERGEPFGRVVGLAPGQPGWRILVAEDNPDNRELITRLLGDVGFQVRAAENGQEAVALFPAWRPHFIWMDMRMPVLDGYQATRQIRALPGGGDVRIVALTASAFQEDRAAILAAGCDEMVRKPVEPERLFAVMAQLLGVRFAYAEAPAAAAPPREIDPALLPPALRKELGLAAEMLDQEAARAVVERLRGEQPELARDLEGLIDGYRFDRLAELCSPEEKGA